MLNWRIAQRVHFRQQPDRDIGPHLPRFDPKVPAMVDCFDRIAVQMTEIALEPIQRLAERPMSMAASVRLPSNGHRVLLTVRKRFPHGEDAAPVYAWRLERLDAAGDASEELAASTVHLAYPTPEAAFWAAADALRDHNLGQLAAG